MNQNTIAQQVIACQEMPLSKILTIDSCEYIKHPILNVVKFQPKIFSYLLAGHSFSDFAGFHLERFSYLLAGTVKPKPVTVVTNVDRRNQSCSNTYSVSVPLLYVVFDTSSLYLWIYLDHSDGSLSPFYWPHIFDNGQVCYDRQLTKTLTEFRSGEFSDPIALFEHALNGYFTTRFAYFDFDHKFLPSQLVPSISYPWFTDDFESYTGNTFDFFKHRNRVGSYLVNEFFQKLSDCRDDQVLNNVNPVKSFTKEIALQQARQEWLRHLRLSKKMIER